MIQDFMLTKDYRQVCVSGHLETGNGKDNNELSFAAALSSG